MINRIPEPSAGSRSKLEDSLQIKVQNIRDWNDVLLEIMGGVLTWKFLGNHKFIFLDIRFEVVKFLLSHNF